MAHPCSEFASGSSGADIAPLRSDLCARCAFAREDHMERDAREPTCWNCGGPADVQLECGHYYCWLCYDRGRDPCNPIVKMKGVEHWEVVP